MDRFRRVGLLPTPTAAWYCLAAALSAGLAAVVLVTHLRWPGVAVHVEEPERVLDGVPAASRQEICFAVTNRGRRPAAIVGADTDY